MPKKLNWEKWALNFWSILAQHLAVALSTWMGVGLVNGAIQWNSLWVAFVMGAFFPSLSKFLGTTPVPEIEEEVTVTQTLTVTKTKAPEEKKDETPPTKE